MSKEIKKLDDESTVQIRLYDDETGKAFYKQLTESEYQVIAALLREDGE